MASLRELRPKLTEYVRVLCASFDYNHDFEHHVRFVARDAEIIAQAENADPDICWTAAMLHELGLVGGREGHDDRGPRTAADFLTSIGADPRAVRRVAEVLRIHHDTALVRNGSAEAQCVHDANELHTVGPNGFLRVFSDMIHLLGSKTRHEAMAELPDYLEHRLNLFCTATARGMAEKHMPLLREFIRRYRAYEEL